MPIFKHDKKQRLVMKQICPKSFERTKVKAAPVPQLSVMHVLFIVALHVFAHHPHTDSRESTHELVGG